jgi:hypothetical protein
MTQTEQENTAPPSPPPYGWLTWDEQMADLSARERKSYARWKRRLDETGTPLTKTQIAHHRERAHALFVNGDLSEEMSKSLHFWELMHLGIVPQLGFQCTDDEWQIVWRWWVNADGDGLTLYQRGYLFSHREHLPRVVNGLLSRTGEQVADWGRLPKANAFPPR